MVAIRDQGSRFRFQGPGFMPQDCVAYVRFRGNESLGFREEGKRPSHAAESSIQGCGLRDYRFLYDLASDF